jgi:UDP-GlcNAc3NAcA epimerase
MLKICTIIGARPQFIKAAMVSKAVRGSDGRVTEVIVHTGQHYDHKMSQSFFDQLDIPEPKYHLDVGSGSHGDQTGRMLSAIEKVLIAEKPDAVLVYGDTNSTIAGSLAAAKLHIPVGHVEGGMRSFNRRMPEEINRVVTDHVAKWHFCSNQNAVDNLKYEGILEGVHLVGDVMHDAVMLYRDVAEEKSDILQRLGLMGEAVEGVIPARLKQESSQVAECEPRITKYALATVHRAENTDDHKRLTNIFEALAEISKDVPVVLPLHPRTQKAIDDAGLRAMVTSCSSLIITDPVPYLDILKLEANASVILTDSGGMQKEAFWFGVPCVTMRDETEWVETVEAGMNVIVGADKTAICQTVNEYCAPSFVANSALLGVINESASISIINLLASC